MLTIRKYVVFLVALLAISGACAQAPYTVMVTPLDTTGIFTTGVQSFAWAQYQGKLLIVGGRTNGFHRTSSKERTFPTQYDNQHFRVIDIINRKTHSAPIPAAFLLPLRTTNMAFCQSGDTLYIAGGYGSTCDTDSASCYQTFPNLSAIHVARMINSIILGNPIDGLITTITDERMRVTGGSLERVGDNFVLVFGQNYNNIYKDGTTGVYTEEIRRFKIKNSGGSLSISDYLPLSSPMKYQGLSQFHRRDLNVFPTILPNGLPGVGALGGVFTKQSGPYPNPMYINASGTGLSAVVDTSFKQRFCLYDCAKMMLYDPTGKNMYTTLFGGITDYSYDTSGNILPTDFDNFMPFFNHVSTVARNSAGVYTEYPQFAPALPGYIGSNAAFVPAPGVATYMNNPLIIDYSKLPAGKPVLVGWMFGGITATDQQASEFNPTYANKVIYSVFLTKNKVPTKTAKPSKKGKRR